MTIYHYRFPDGKTVIFFNRKNKKEHILLEPGDWLMSDHPLLKRKDIYKLLKITYNHWKKMITKK